MKAPTSVLLDEDRNFVAFSYDEESKYLASLERDDSGSDSEDEKVTKIYHYFSRFKMMLHKQVNFSVANMTVV